MKIMLKQDKFTAIDSAFSIINGKVPSENNPETIKMKYGLFEGASKIIKDSLDTCFDLNFTINIVQAEKPNSPIFVMAVYPELSTIDKIVNELMKNDEKKVKVIENLWKQNENWTIEIDERIFMKDIVDFSDRELTAMLLHEVGHVICSNSIVNRINVILQYEIAKSNMNNKFLIKNKLFRKVLSFPILNACIFGGKDKSSIKEEIKADSFCKKMGYSNDLLSALNKIIKSNKYNSSTATPDQSMMDTAKFAINSINDLRERRANLAKKNLFALKENCPSPYIESAIDDFYNLFFEEHMDSSVHDGKKLAFMETVMDRIIDNGYTTEFFLFKSKKLKKIDPAELDYIEINIPEIHNESDKMMLISYLYYKLDTVQYYKSILEDKELSKKYIIPHTYDQLVAMEKRLYQLRDVILKYKIPEKSKQILVSWPEGYEG